MPAYRQIPVPPVFSSKDCFCALSLFFGSLPGDLTGGGGGVVFVRALAQKTVG